jgi:hypothetical protein
MTQMQMAGGAKNTGILLLRHKDTGADGRRSKEHGNFTATSQRHRRRRQEEQSEFREMGTEELYVHASLGEMGRIGNVQIAEQLGNDCSIKM